MSAARDSIIVKTCELLELQGYHATGLNQIIKESGSPKGSLYHYFPGGKEELAVESVEYIGGLVLQRIERHLAEVEAPDQAVRGFIEMVAAGVERADYRGGGPITTIALEVASTSERLRKVCQGIYDSWRALFADKLRAGGIDSMRAFQVGALIVAALEGGIILARTERSPAPLYAIAAEIGALIQMILSYNS